jgi:nucleotide-binding universal stress UspA family protein
MISDESLTPEIVAESAQEHDKVQRIIVIALDQSAYSEHAFHWALDNVLRKSDLAVLLHVRQVPVIPGPFGALYLDYGEYLDRIEDENREESHDLLRYYAGLLKMKDVPHKAIALRGDAREEILRKTGQLQANVIVLGSRGLGMFKRLAFFYFLILSPEHFSVH